MAQPPRRFGSYHRYAKPVEPQPFKPHELDPLIIESISPELSRMKSDKTVESYAQAKSGDETVETLPNSLTRFEKDFHRNCGKPCGKVAF